MILAEKYRQIRKHSEQICEPLETEDYVVQPIVDVSPPKWHLGHTTWFFETFILQSFLPGYELYNVAYNYVFNSYYETVGSRVIRTDRGNLSRPGVKEIYQYRAYVDAAMLRLLENPLEQKAEELLLLGFNHEQQHQELLLTDIKYILGHNPLFPAYRTEMAEHVHQVEAAQNAEHLHHAEHPEHIEVAQKGGHLPHAAQPQNIEVSSRFREMKTITAGLYEIGYAGTDFCFDNELGRHKVYLPQFSISSNLVSNAEYLEFINSGGYENFVWWHSEGWDWVNNNKILAPMYWHSVDGVWQNYTLEGFQPLDLYAPLTHISYYEAYAYASWAKMRLPTEFEWEVAADSFKWGQRWEWTESAYLPYPGFSKAPGAIGEYNGKFMVNQKVLRGASVATPAEHSRVSYRNFFHPHLRWQFTGIRLAK
ncbi:ergothioneine biosynthesis protein EgtB [Pedobacter sp. PLR]|uniref:ergothioneine biosynthesis protein EgtB n=1 Tax=Pedobacter sp. PLR TaxID=2994465 RepID=UPI0022466419|nr:ergothioneine biosynthesis protein EgtB [Pedobacter sp. PLR]MCX2452584.1 ergothioneine biosynthesis protein EgtB [Pedobacter sp. PLR]